MLRKQLNTDVGRILAVALAYFGAAEAGLAFAVVGNTVTLVWPPSGIALVAILIFGYRMALGVFAGAFLANILGGLSPLLATSIAVGNTGEALIGVLLLFRVAKFRGDLRRRKDILALISLAAIASTMISASFGSLTLVLGNIVAPAGYPQVWLKWWLGDMMGILVVAPLLLVCCHHQRARPKGWGIVEAVVLVGAVVGISHAIFGTPELAGHGYYPASLAVFPFVIWGALRFGHWGAVGVTSIIATLAIWGTSQGSGPFAVASMVDSLVGWCAFANILAVTGLLLAASRAEQQQDQAALQQARDQLELRVLERTQDLARVNSQLSREIAERRRLESNLIKVSELQQKSIGQELHDGLGQHLTSLAFLGAGLAQNLRRQGLPESESAERIVQLLNDAIRMTHEIAKGLYPVALDSRGLPGALEQLVDGTRSASRLDCAFRTDLQDTAFDPLLAINLYRFAQEAISNVVKHSRARRLWVDLRGSDGQRHLSISDDGIGIDTPLLEASGGIGIHSLRHRANLLDGQFEIRRNEHGGTSVSVTYREQEGDHDR